MSAAESQRLPHLGARTGNNLGRYQLVAPLGQGGMGTIHLAVAGGLADFRKLLVVKELRQDLSSNRRFVEMFLDEAKLAARLNHPNVVQTLEAGQEGERYFLSMEFLDGQPYSAIWKGAGQFPQVSLAIRLKILCDALAGLHYAHTLTEYDGANLHIVHRDVSPQNIFVTYDGQVKVVDFGIAKATVSSELTSPGMFKGKFAYAAPEQVRGEEVDARTDVFAMGVILWETLAMQRFNDGVVNRASVATRLAGNEPRAAQYMPMLDTRLAEICDCALSVDPDGRFSSADEFRLALEDYLARSGQRVEVSAIKRVMANKFAAERRAVHRLIDDHIKNGTAAESGVKMVSLGSDSGNNNATAVADLSKYIRDTTSETIVSGLVKDVASAPRGPNPRMFAAGAAAAVVALGLAFGVMRSSSSAAPSAASPIVTAVQLPAAVTMQAPAAAVLQPSAAAAAATPPAPTPVAAAAPAAAVNEEVSARSVGRAAPRRAARPRASLPLAAEQPPAPAALEVPPAHVEAHVPTAIPVTSAAVGVDLNRVEKAYQRRSIDTSM